MSRLDLTPVRVAHAALRRDAGLLARLAADSDDWPWRVLRTAVGWELFATCLHVHQAAEDEALWPVLRVVAAGRPADLALLSAMEAEHVGVSVRVAAVEDALNDEADGPRRTGMLVDALVDTLTAHLRREEDEALPLAEELLTERQWALFGAASRRLAGPDTPRILPWLLDGASEEDVAAMLAPLSRSVRAEYRAAWWPAYAAVDHWGAG